MKILLLIPAPLNISPGQRFRFEHYIGLNTGKKIEFVPRSFFSKKTWSIIHLPKHYIGKIVGILAGFIRRFFLMFTLYQYDYVYVYREASVIGPPVFEWLISKVFRKKIIYDFDDAIWVSMASASNPGAASLKCTWKVANICRMSYIVTVGNDFLGDYARQYCKDVRLIPTVVDTELQHNILKNHEDKPLVIGWTGTYTNFHNLDSVTPVISKLEKKYEFTFLIIADKDPCFKDINYTYIKWNLNTEISDLLKIHIGIMPLKKSDVELGKCAFKAIQYMSLGIPAVVTPVGANAVIVQNHINGIWADSPEEWYTAIEILLNNAAQRSKIGALARAHIENKYSVRATYKQFFDLFK